MDTSSCFVCKVEFDVQFKRYYSTKNDSYYFYSAEKNISVWAQNAYQFNHLCTRCVETICEASWKQEESKSNPNHPYFFNSATCQSRRDVPQLTHNTDMLTAAARSTAVSSTVELGNKFYHTPQSLQGKRDYFFKGMQKLLQAKPAAAQLQQASLYEAFQIDKVASFSVTKSEIATQITDMILQFCKNNRTLSICDGMACVGGNTLSFAQHFSKVVSNEFDYER